MGGACGESQHRNPLNTRLTGRGGGCGDPHHERASTEGALGDTGGAKNAGVVVDAVAYE
jgi:hypothetical protein